MELYYLKIVFAPYEGWSLRKLLIGLPPEIIQIQSFLEKFSHQPDNYTFTTADIFHLCQLMPANSTEYGIQMIIKALHPIHKNKNFLKTFHYLNHLSLLTEKNFSILFDSSNARVLGGLFCNELEGNIHCDKKVYREILKMITHFYPYANKTMNIIRFLHNKNQLTKKLLSTIRRKCDENCLPTLNVLSKSNHLNADTILDLFKKRSEYKNSQFIFENINKTNMMINERFLQLIKIRNKKIDFHLEEILPLFIAYPDFDIIMLNTILNEDYILDTQRDLLKIFIQFSMLNHSLLEFICKKYSIAFYHIIKILADTKLLSHSQLLIDKIIDESFSSKVVESFLEVLHKKNLLNQNFIDSFLDKNDKKWRTALINIFFELERYHTDITKEDIETLFRLSLKDLNRLTPIIRNMNENKLLNHETFNKILTVIKEKLPRPIEFHLNKNDPVISHPDRKEMNFDNHEHIFIEQKFCDSGGQGEITKAYLSLDAKDPHFGIKKFTHSTSLGTALNDVQYNLLLGRNAFYFMKNNRVHVVYEWQKEKALSDFLPEELLRKSFIIRLHCLISGLTDLSFLHMRYRIHNDIKPENIILYFDCLRMRLIDFGGAHKKNGSPKGRKSSIFAHTPDYSDPYTWTDHFCRDVYSFGFIIKALFPEIYPDADSEKTDPNFTEKSIIQLVNNMMNEYPEKRCSSKDALAYCRQITAKIPYINEEFLTQIRDEFLISSNKKNIENCYLKL